MILINQSLINKHLETESELKFGEFLNKKIFKVANTPLTYRQINSLSEDNLLPEDNERDKGWRKFSFKEIVYLELVKELKAFGLKHGELRELWNSFFKEHKKRSTEPELNNKYEGEIALFCVLGEIEINLTIDSSGGVAFFDPLYYVFMGKNSKPVIQIELNSVVNGIFKLMGRKEIPAKVTVESYLKERYAKPTNLSNKEEELIKIIRNNSFSAIRIKKKDGEIELVYAEKTLNTNQKTKTDDLIKILQERDFQDISLVQRDGEIVHLTVEETIKLG